MALVRRVVVPHRRTPTTPALADVLVDEFDYPRRVAVPKSRIGFLLQPGLGLAPVIVLDLHRGVGELIPGHLHTDIHILRSARQRAFDASVQ